MYTPFQKQVLDKIIEIPKGKITTYSILAAAIGNPSATRAVANALGKNQSPVLVPCYKIIKSNGDVGGYSSELGAKEKIRLLEGDGLKVENGRVVDYEKFLWKF